MKLLTYQYLFRTSEMVDAHTFGVKVITATEREHEDFIETLKADQAILSCSRSYQGEYDLSLLNSFETVKKLANADYDGAKDAGLVGEKQEEVL